MLKSMLKKFCLESAKERDKGLPLLLFAVRETTQESFGFSPAYLVFSHTVRGPLRLLKDKRLSHITLIEHNILDYVSAFRECLHHACETAQETLLASQLPRQ